jgi:hypothetical protein
MDSYTTHMRDYLCFCRDTYGDPTAKVTQERVTRFVVTFLRHTKNGRGKRVGGVVGKSTVDNFMSALRWLKVRLSCLFV